MSEIKSGCEYRVLDNGIHEVVLTDFSRAGADAYYMVMRQINDNLPPGETALVLVDARQGMMPINYTFGRFRDGTHWSENFRVATLLQSGVMNNVIGNMMRMFPRIGLRLFTPDKRETAIDWLMQK
jgi:hypothetical protein